MLKKLIVILLIINTFGCYRGIDENNSSESANYKVVGTHLMYLNADRLEKYYEQGWELVSHTSDGATDLYTFKKRK